MKEIPAQLSVMIDDFEKQFLKINSEKFSEKPLPEKWSKKEELGHLIDSAHNNLRRFIVTQYEILPNISYNQEMWVKASDYQNQQPENLIALWKLLNKQIVVVLQNCPPKKSELLCETGKMFSDKRSIKWLAEDYIKHLQHHLHHILGLEEIPYK
jgi:hypothetical protein